MLADATQSLGSAYIPEERRFFPGFGDYLAALDAAGLGINVVSLIGHCTLRIAVMGTEQRSANPEEMEKMKALVEEAMKHGAFGMSTGLAYVPGNYASQEEIVELCRVAARYGGIYCSHIRNERDDVDISVAEAISIGREAGVPVQISHHKVAGTDNWGRSLETLKMIEDARAEGIEVTCDQYPYHASSTSLASLLPTHSLAGGYEVYRVKLKDPKFRKALVEELRGDRGDGWENLIRGTGFDRIVISRSTKNPDYIGRSLADIAESENKNPYDLVFDLVAQEGQGMGMILFSMNDEDVERIMRAPFTMIGSDGGPSFGKSRVHPRFCGTFPRVLGRYARELGVLSMEEAVRKMTSLPAATFGVKGKGLLREGFDADIVLFDPETVIDTATFEEPLQTPKGIQTVIVNGTVAVENGVVTRTAKGEVLRRG